jgi:hypothetical protein
MVREASAQQSAAIVSSISEVERPLFASRLKQRARSARSTLFLGGAAFDDPVDGGVVVVQIAPDEREELGGKDIVRLEEFSVAAATIHQRGGEFAAELGFHFRDDAGEPFDAADGVGLRGKFRFVEHDGGGFAVLNVEKVVAADELYAEGDFETGFARVIVVILGVVVDVLGGDAVGGEKGAFLGGQQRGGLAFALCVEGNGIVVDGAERLGEIVVSHVAD